MLKTITFFISAKTPLKAIGNSNFLTPDAKLTFFRLKQAFIEVLIFYHFNSECYIGIQIDASNYSIDDILSQLISKSG